ncbi:MAG TPA: hypothetical protein VGE52_20680, partial [Pirellulales bacterium]
NSKASARNYNIFFAVSERDGKDAKGRFKLVRDEGMLWERVDHDLQEIAAAFAGFRRTEKVTF